jgi:hypothetical protein
MLDFALGRLRRAATRRTILFCLALYLLFSAALLPIAGARLEAYSGGAGMLDTLVGGFSPEEAYARLAAYGLDGRLYYLLIELTLDTLYPLVTLLFYSLALSFLNEHAFPPGHAFQLAPLVAVAGGLFDYMENAGVVVLLLTYPQSLTAVAAVTGAVALVKWVLTFATMGLLLVGIGALALGRRRPAGSASA